MRSQAMWVVGILHLLFLLGCRSVHTPSGKLPEAEPSLGKRRIQVRFVSKSWMHDVHEFHLGDVIHIMAMEPTMVRPLPPQVYLTLKSAMGDVEVLKLTEIRTIMTSGMTRFYGGLIPVRSSRAFVDGNGTLEVGPWGGRIIAIYTPLGSEAPQSDTAWVKP